MRIRIFKNPSTSNPPFSLSAGFMAGAALLAMATAVPLQAQAPDQSTQATATDSSAPYAEDLMKATELEARAWALRDLMDERETAARLYRQAADLRPDHDPQKVQNLRQASRMSHYAGRSDRAVRDAETAARAALRQGDVIEAGQAYVDAAWLSAQIGDRSRTEEFLKEARLLAASPLLAQEERQNLLRRIDEAV